MFVDEGRTEVGIAAAMKISGARLAAVLTELGVDRGRRVRRVCPVGEADLRVLLEQGATVASLARRFGVAKVTVQRWLAGAGLLLADPAVDVDALSRLYVEQGRTIGEVAAALGLCRARVEVALAVAGIPARRRTEPQPSGRRADVTDEMLRELYSRPEVTVRVLVERFGVSQDYLRRRLHALGLTRRPGTFAPRLPSPTRQGLAGRAPTLYRQGWTLKQIAEELGTSVSTVRAALVAARVPVRGAGGGPRSSERPASAARRPVRRPRQRRRARRARGTSPRRGRLAAHRGAPELRAAAPDRRSAHRALPGRGTGHQRHCAAVRGGQQHGQQRPARAQRRATTSQDRQPLEAAARPAAHGRRSPSGVTGQAG